MTNSTIPMLKQAIGITGAEQMEAVQFGSSVRVTAAQIAALGVNLVPLGPTGVAADAPNGTVNDYTVGGEMNASIGFIELTPSGNAIINGLQAGFDGQPIIISNLSATFTVTLEPLNGGSLSANQFRLAAPLVITQYQTQAFEYSGAIGVWIPT